MKKTIRTIGLGIIAIVLSLPFLACAGKSLSPLAAAPPVNEEALTKLLKSIRPQPGEDAFDTIPWEVSLWDARIKAAKEGKPILLWEMDGHPLGCG